MEQHRSFPMTHRLKKRGLLVFCLFTLLFLALSLRLFYLQAFASGDLTEKGIDQQMREVPVEAERGTICDRNGNPLAVSISVESVYASPTEIRGSEAPAIAKTLAELLDLDEE